MQRLAKVAILAELIEQLRAGGSWCGETHIQKAVHFLQAVLKVPLEYQFILYKHGPFSFDLRDELAIAKADSILDFVPQPIPYGPKWATLEPSQRLRGQFPKTMGAYMPQITFVAKHLAAKDVSKLERLATALYVMREEPNRLDVDHANRIHTLKPHIPMADALAALDEVRKIEHEAQSVAVSA